MSWYTYNTLTLIYNSSIIIIHEHMRTVNTCH
nr:MAG TPA: hypothetical protein [Bacteriophage sp.]DAV14361.1 MAG TPA: hypothetical protein [Caudoviricetes sp.]